MTLALGLAFVLVVISVTGYSNGIWWGFNVVLPAWLIGQLVFMPYLARFEAAEPCPRCLSCDYDLREMTHGKCPECGRLFDYRAT